MKKEQKDPDPELDEAFIALVQLAFMGIILIWFFLALIDMLEDKLN